MPSRRDQSKETNLHAGSLVTLPRTAGERGLHNAASTVRRVNLKGHTRDKEVEANESVAISPTLATPDEEYWAALTQWKTACMLMNSGCTDHIVRNIYAFLDFMPIKSVVRK